MNECLLKVYFLDFDAGGKHGQDNIRIPHCVSVIGCCCDSVFFKWFHLLGNDIENRDLRGRVEDLGARLEKLLVENGELRNAKNGEINEAGACA